MKIVSFVKTDGGCDEYRCVLPLDAIKRHETVKMLNLTIGDPISKVVEAVEADLVMIPRMLGEADEVLMNHIHLNKKKCVTDFDDNLFDISPFSNHYEEYGTKNVQIRAADGSIRNLWKDGETFRFNIKENKKRLESAKRCVEQADGVMVTTEKIAEVYRQYTDKVYVAPNSVNLSEWIPHKIKRDNPDEIRVYWSGGSSHYEDIVLLKDVFPAIVKKYPNVKIVMMGMNFTGATKNIPKENFEYHDWVHTKAYPYKTRLLDIDIALIPLQDTTFNACKSNIKWVEQGSLLTPCVTSLVSPYKEHYNGVNGVFIENNTEEGWYKGIAHLIENPIDRWKIGAEARKTVENKFNIDKNYKIWYDVFKEIVDGK